MSNFMFSSILHDVAARIYETTKRAPTQTRTHRDAA